MSHVGFTATQQLTEEQLEQKRINQRYTENIDQVFAVTREETNRNLCSLKEEIHANSSKFDNEYLNLKSYIQDQVELEENKKKKKSYALE